MITYNTDLKPLEMPEYGRVVQQMIDWCVSIPYREERTGCAYAIAAVMKSKLMAAGAEVTDKKVWDQMMIMSGFRLDVDFPIEVVTREELNPEARSVPYTNERNFDHNYGRNIKGLVDACVQLEEGPQRDAMIHMIANHMKKELLMFNPEAATDRKVLADLAAFSEGKIVLDPETYQLNEYVNIEPVTDGKKKKKKK